MKEITDTILEKNLQEALKVKEKLVFSVDFTWDSRNKGKCGTLTATCPFKKSVLFRKHILRTGKWKNFNVNVFFSLSFGKNLTHFVQ